MHRTLADAQKILADRELTLVRKCFGWTVHCSSTFVADEYYKAADAFGNSPIEALAALLDMLEEPEERYL